MWIAMSMLLLALLGRPSMAQTADPESLDRGFTHLYDLDFVEARREFRAWQEKHPEDPLGPVSEAAGSIFSEFNRLGVLEAQFYESDSAFAARKKLSPDPTVREEFMGALDRAEALARAGLAKDARDPNALYAMALSSGLKADYAALIEKRNLASLHFSRDAGAWAQQLLAVDPSYYDAYVATGVSKYLVGSQAPPVRWVLRLGGVSGDKRAGMAELQLAAEHGRYLGPFARILLAIAYVREKDKAQAMQLLAALRDQFPGNPIFSRELARLGPKP